MNAVVMMGGAASNVAVRHITVSAATNTKTYDGSASASAVPTVTGGSLASGDTGVFSEVYANKNVGSSETLTPSGSVNNGGSGTNYSVTFVANTTGKITVRSITVSAATNTKTYDGTTTPSATPTITGGSTASGDTAAFTEVYASSDVGTGLTLTALGSVNDGNAGNNYAVTFVNDTTGEIDVLAITVTAATNTKTFDGDTTASAVPTVTGGVIATGDTGVFSETYDTSAVGTDKTLTPAGTVNDGNGGNNYTITFVNDTTGTITSSGPTTYLYDTFVEASPPVDLAAHTMNVGPGWTELNSTMSINPSGTVVFGAADAFALSQSASEGSHSDGVVTAIGSAQGSTDVFGVVLRYDPSGAGSWLLAFFQRQTTTLFLYYVSAYPTITLLTSVPFTPSQAFTITATLSGASVSVTADDGAGNTATLTDSSGDNQAATQMGIVLSTLGDSNVCTSFKFASA